MFAFKCASDGIRSTSSPVWTHQLHPHTRIRSRTYLHTHTHTHTIHFQSSRNEVSISLSPPSSNKSLIDPNKLASADIRKSPGVSKFPDLERFSTVFRNIFGILSAPSGSIISWKELERSVGKEREQRRERCEGIYRRQRGPKYRSNGPHFRPQMMQNIEAEVAPVHETAKEVRLRAWMGTSERERERE